MSNSAFERALSRYLSDRTPGFDVRRDRELFDAFTPCAEAVIGDMARKFQLYLFPKVSAAGKSGITIGDVRIAPIPEGYGDFPGCEVHICGDLAFRITTLHTRAYRGMNPRDTVSVFREFSDRSLAHATITPSLASTPWTYVCYDGPGAMPGVVEACEAVLPFIADEIAKDTLPTVSKSANYAPYLALVASDGGLPGKSVAAFSKAVLDDGMSFVAEWVAKALPSAQAKLGRLAGWPDNSLVYYDSEETVCVLSSDHLVGLVHYLPLRDEDATATVTLLRTGKDGQPLLMSTHRIPIDRSIVADAVTYALDGGEIGYYPSMAFDFASRSVTTTPGYLETRVYGHFASGIDTALIDWKGKREETYVSVNVFSPIEELDEATAVSEAGVAPSF